MNHSCNSRVLGLYTPFTSVPDPRNKCDLTILSVPSGDGCLRNTIVARKRAGTRAHHSARPGRRGMPAYRSQALCTLVAPYSIRNSPPTHSMASREVVSTWVRMPVTGSTLTAAVLRRLVWIGVLATVLDGRDCGRFGVMVVCSSSGV